MTEITRAQILREAEIIKRSRSYRKRFIVPGHLQRIRAPYWTIVRTPHGREKFAKLNIEKRGNRAFIPRVHDGLHGPKLTPLFPGYVFVLIEHGQWMHLQYSPGTIEIVKFGGNAARVDDLEMFQMLKDQGADGYIELSPTPEPLDPDDKIIIGSGVFKDHHARYVGLAPDNRIRCLIGFFGKESEIILRRRDVEKIT